MEDSLQNGAVAIGDVSILPVKRNTVGSEVPVPEAQCASTHGHRELLIEGAVPGRLPAADVACQCRKSATVHLIRADDRIVNVPVNYPRRKVTGLEPFILDYSAI